MTFPLFPGARLALASKARGQREQFPKDAAPCPRVASLHSAARPRAVKQASPWPELHARTRNPTRKSWAVDPSMSRFKEERYFRRRPLHDFERDEKFSLSQPTR